MMNAHGIRQEQSVKMPVRTALKASARNSLHANGLTTPAQKLVHQCALAPTAVCNTTVVCGIEVDAHAAARVFTSNPQSAPLIQACVHSTNLQPPAKCVALLATLVDLPLSRHNVNKTPNVCGMTSMATISVQVNAVSVVLHSPALRVVRSANGFRSRTSAFVTASTWKQMRHAMLTLCATGILRAVHSTVPRNALSERPTLAGATKIRNACGM